MMRRLVFTVACLVVLPQCSGKRPANLGITKGALSVCPSSPNCVSSQQSTDDAHYISPIRYNGTLTQARNAIISVINSMDRTRIVTDKNNYLHAEFTSALFRFVDDVEFYFDDREKIIHLRSASRVGYWDFGVNRERIETIRTRFMELLNEK
jgi:uncharacterized protein (DUF1499 family)